MLSGSAAAASLITTAQIKDGSIQAKDLSTKARTALKGNRGPSGIAGSRGATGAPGAPGAPGQRGPSDGFVFTHVAEIGLPNTTPLSAALPAGRFVITAKFMINNNDTTSRRPACTLIAATDRDTALIGTSENARDDDTAVGTLIVAHEFAAPGTTTLACDSGGAPAGDMVMSDVQIAAVQVATLTRAAI